MQLVCTFIEPKKIVSVLKPPGLFLEYCNSFAVSYVLSNVVSVLKPPGLFLEYCNSFAVSYVLSNVIFCLEGEEVDRLSCFFKASL
jgi:hypothetical protein